MSTRATIKVIEHGTVKYRIYHHFDGYPEGVGEELKEFFTNDENYNADELLKNGIENGLDGDTSYVFEDTTERHGDEEYEYTIDCDNKKILCYNLHKNEEILL